MTDCWAQQTSYYNERPDKLGATHQNKVVVLGGLHHKVDPLLPSPPDTPLTLCNPTFPFLPSPPLPLPPPTFSSLARPPKPSHHLAIAL